MTRPARRPAWAARRRVAACAAAVLALLAVPAGSAPAVPAPYAEHAPVPGLRVVLDDVEPAVPRAGEPVVLRGRVVNDTTTRQRVTSVTAEAAWTTLTGRATVEDWVSGADGRRTDWLLGTDAVGPVVAPGAEVPFTVPLPAETTAGLPPEPAVLALELHAHDGAQDPWTGLVETAPATLKTVLTVGGGAEVAAPLQVSWLVPLTLPPDPALMRSEEEEWRAAWQSAVGRGSTARTWLDGFDVPGVTWAVDPALLVANRPEQLPGAEVPAPDGGAATGGAGGETGSATTAPSPTPTPTSPGDDDGVGDDGVGDAGVDQTARPTGDAGPTETPGAPGQPTGGPEEDPPSAEEAVRADLAQLRARLDTVAGDRLWWLPAHDPDLAALLRADPEGVVLPDLLGRRPAAPDSVQELLARGRTDVAWPLLTGATAADLRRLQSVWTATGADGPAALAAAVLPREAVVGGSTAAVTRGALPLADPAGLTVLASDSRATALLAAAGDDAAQRGAGAAVQRLLADTLTAWLQDPLAQRSMLVAPPRETRAPLTVLEELSDGVSSAPWIDAVPADALLDDAVGVAPALLTGAVPDAGQLGEAAAYLEPGASPLDPQGVRRLVALGRQLQGLQEVLEEDAAPDSWESTLVGAWSTRWRGDPERWARSWRGVSGASQEARQALHINPSTINFLSDQGLLSLTIVNTLPVAVEGVRVQLVPSSSILRVVSQPEPITIGPESRATVTFSARAVTRGETTVTARLTAPNGTVLGDNAAVDVRVQPTGVWIYWVLGGVAGVVLTLGLTRALRSTPRAVVAAARGARVPPSPPPPAAQEER